MRLKNNLEWMKVTAHKSLEYGLHQPDLDFQISRMDFIQQNDISLLLDIGANTGEYACNMRNSGYAGKIVSFEPASAEFRKLSSLASQDPNWECLDYAIGDYDGVLAMNIAGNSWSSSLLPMLDRHLESAPESKYIGSELVNIVCLDNIFPKITLIEQNIYLKLDVQGYELQALLGANQILAATKVIEIELSLVPLYEGQQLYLDVIDYLEQMGFDLIYYECNFFDPISEEALQIDGIFMQRDRS